MKNRIVEVICTGLCTALVLWSISLFREDQATKFKDMNERARRIEENYITKEDFNRILEAKLKQFKVTKDGRLIVAP